MLITRIQLSNIRGFRELDVVLSTADASARRTTLIIGRNGTCKTTLLRAIALGVCDHPDVSDLLSEPIGGVLGEEAARGEITLRLEPLPHGPHRRLHQTIERINGKEAAVGITDPGHPQPFVCGYGAGRYRVGPETKREYRVADSVYSLFADRASLIDPELTLRRLRDYLGTERYEATLGGIKKALDLMPADTIHLPRGGGIELSGPSIGKRVPLEGWADGYRVTFSWLLDLYAWAMRADRINDDGQVEGIVLVDELEQHLHPAMQSRILPRLVEVLPRVQLIATTHSPLVALGAAPEELVVLRRVGEAVVAETSVPDFSGYSAEDMLVDERLFDAEVYSPQTNRMLARYHELASRLSEQRTEVESRELRRLAQTLRAQQVPEVRESELAQELRRLPICGSAWRAGS